MMRRRREQAMQTVIIDTTKASFDRMMAHVSQYGAIRKVFLHEAQAKSYFIVEYERKNFARDLIRDVGYAGNVTDACFMSTGRFLKYQPGKQTSAVRHFQLERDMRPTTWEKLLDLTRSHQTSNEQIQALYDHGSISDLSSRLRFVAALQIEEAVQGIGSDVRVIPFGSTVNGFGRTSSDLDMILMTDPSARTSNELQFLQAGRTEHRAMAPRNLGVISYILESWLPGVTNVEKVLTARVPIIKYEHSITGLECDLSMSNM